MEDTRSTGIDDGGVFFIVVILLAVSAVTIFLFIFTACKHPLTFRAPWLGDYLYEWWNSRFWHLFRAVIYAVAALSMRRARNWGKLLFLTFTPISLACNVYFFGIEEPLQFGWHALKILGYGLAAASLTLTPGTYRFFGVKLPGEQQYRSERAAGIALMLTSIPLLGLSFLFWRIGVPWADHRDYEVRSWPSGSSRQAEPHDMIIHNLGENLFLLVVVPIMGILLGYSGYSQIRKSLVTRKDFMERACRRQKAIDAIKKKANPPPDS